MGRPISDLHGKQFGRLTVIAHHGFRGKHSTWECVCTCGVKKVVLGAALKKGLMSCGCLAREVHSAVLTKINTKHGLSKSRAYSVWQSMLARCYRQSHEHFKDYGGRGISVCNEWLGAPHGFEKFLADMGQPPEGLTLDRRDNNGPYNPENCRWATATQQVRNSRVVKYYEVNGQRMLAKDLAALFGIKEGTMRWRLSHWGLDRTLASLPAAVA